MANPKAQVAKEKGNTAFKAGDYPNAIGHYTAAILADKSDYTFPLNRAAAYLKLGKNEDAERDCTTVLSLSAVNAKALFRRGQARIGMDKLEESMSDLSQALKREPANGAIKAEIKKATELLEKKKAKASNGRGKDQLPPSIPTPKRRRVPITIVDSTTPTTSSDLDPTSSSNIKTKAPSPAPPPKPSSTLVQPKLSNITETTPETLKPISTRSLKSSPAVIPLPTTTPSELPTTPSSPASAPKSVPTPTPKQPRSFKDAKQVRDTEKPSRVGGGIFRASGENTVFPTRTSGASSNSTPSPSPSSASASPATSTPTPTAAVIHPMSPEKVPTTLFEFARTWDAEVSPSQRWGLILSVLPGRLPALFKTSLEPALLASILGLFREVLRAGPSPQVREYMDALARVERFGTVLLFLSLKEKTLAREVWEVLGVGKEAAGDVWAKVWA